MAQAAATKRWRMRAHGMVLVVFLLLLPLVGSASGTLCIGADGHVNLELRGVEGCGDDAGQSHEASQAHRGHGDAEAPPCCGPCTHVHATSGDGVTSASAAKLPAAALLPARPVPPPACVERTGVSPAPSPALGARARILASVVLRR